MLIPHNPSTNLRRAPNRLDVDTDDYADVIVTVNEAPDPEPARSVPTGRMAAMNRGVAR